MSDKSQIQWTDATWNPTTGCTKVSPGCANCYIERTPAFRIAGRKFVKGHIPLKLHSDRLDQPLHWRKPRRVFVNSLSDLFHDDVDPLFVARVFNVMAQARRHQFQILTKRPERMLAIVPELARFHTAPDGSGWPLPNVWLGVSVENQRFADERIPLLLQTPAAVRFISAEPLLGPVYLGDIADASRKATCGWPIYDALRGYDGYAIKGPRLDWVIVGGESGPGARPFNVEWARSIVAQCKAAGVACFVKQLGGCITGLNLDGPPYSSPPRREGFLVHWTCRENNTFGLCDRKGGDPAEWPEDLRVREFPATT